MKSPKISIIIPAKNEAPQLRHLLPEIRGKFPDTEIIVVDDGSTDDTPAVCAPHGAKVISHPYSKGNGAAVKTGARHASGDIIVFMDGDGQHDPADIERIIKPLIEGGYDMVVGARTSGSQASVGRWAANGLYNRLASWMVNQTVRDLTSGFRAVKRTLFLEFLHLLPNGFSYPTTITMSFFRAGYSVGYIPIVARKREGKSHINLMRDGVRFLLIIFKVGTLYSPLKLFFPISGAFLITGIFYYLYTFLTIHRFTNMSGLLFTTAVLVFLIGLVSEQITALMYNSQARFDHKPPE